MAGKLTASVRGAYCPLVKRAESSDGGDVVAWTSAQKTERLDQISGAQHAAPSVL